MKRMYYLLLILLFVGCSKLPSEEITKEKNEEIVESPAIENSNALHILESTMNDYYEQIYNPLTLSVNDRVADMIATDVSVKDIEGSIIIDVYFLSQELTISGEFINLHSVDPGYMNTIVFLPDENSLKHFPIHNLYEHEIRLIISDEQSIEKFNGKDNGTATIIVKNFYDFSRYSDEMYENTTLVDVLNIN